MTVQELLCMFIQERINMLIDIFYKNQPDKAVRCFLNGVFGVLRTGALGREQDQQILLIKLR